MAKYPYNHDETWIVSFVPHLVIEGGKNWSGLRKGTIRVFYGIRGMAKFESTGGMQDVQTVIREPLRFKLKLDIGDQAYSSLRRKKYLLDSVDAANGAATGLVFAKSSLVASTFFAPSGFLGALGIGTAVTPVGWAIGATRSEADRRTLRSILNKGNKRTTGSL